MPLRHRPTGKIFERNLSGTKVQHASRFFSKKPKISIRAEEEAVDSSYFNFLHEISTQNPKLPGLTDFLQQNEAAIKKIAEDEKTLASMQEQAVEGQKALEELKKLDAEAVKGTKASYVTKVVQFLVNNRHSLVAMMYAMMLAQAEAVDATNNITPHEGQPTGGIDLCKGILFGCAQGFLTNGTQAWSSMWPQYNRVVNEATIGSDVQYREQLRLCMDPIKVGTMLKNLLTGVYIGDALNNTNDVCMAQSTIWKGWQLSSTATSLSTNACSSFKDRYLMEGQQCMSWFAANSRLALILGLAIGLGVGGAALCCAGYFLYKKHCANRSKIPDQGTPLMQRV